MIYFSQLPQLLHADLIQLAHDVAIDHLITDSRKVVLAQGSVFFAIKGERHDGHQFLNALYQQGIRNFVVEQQPAVLPKDANYVRVTSSIEALQLIVAYHRAAFSIPIIGTTGSNGKTIVKEWLYQLLSPKFSIAKNPGSYNSQLGVPLSVWNLQQHHTLGIFEAGISKPGEMQKLQRVIKPTLGIFTNIGPAHDEGFENEEQKIEEKCKLFEDAELLIYCKDHTTVDKKVKTLKLPSLTWGYSKTADVYIAKTSGYTVHYKEKAFQLHLPFGDPASVENCFHCVATMLHLGFSADEIQSGIDMLRAVPMRMELKEGINQSQIIDDSYNNDLAGLQISLDFLSNQQQRQRRVLVLSDILQSGVATEVWTRQVATLIARNQIDLFLGIGTELQSHKDVFPTSSLFFDSTNSFLHHLNEEWFSNSIVLVKGARTFAFERIAQRLQRKIHGTVMEIDLGAMVHNLNYFKSRLKPATRIMAMVKAFAYGSGSREVANLLQYHKIDYLGVAYADEGVELRKNNIRLPIMVMNPSAEAFENIINYSLEPEIYSFSLLNQFIHFLDGKACRVHIKFDTGMHRLGFNETDLPVLISTLQQNSNLQVASIFSHLAGADEAQHDSYSKQQATIFLTLANQVSDALGYKPLYHLLNSPGILRLPHYQFDMVRLGIGLYGIDPTAEGNSHLKPVATLKTVVSQVHELKEGDTVGYGRHGKIAGSHRIATIAIGYADGYSRAFSKGVGEVFINGKTVPVIGNVCMDMTMVDVTGLDVKEGDEVIVFGEGMPIDVVAKKINTIPYEILTNTSERVKRVFVAEGI